MMALETAESERRANFCRIKSDFDCVSSRSQIEFNVEKNDQPLLKQLLMQGTTTRQWLLNIIQKDLE